MKVTNVENMEGVISWNNSVWQLNQCSCAASSGWSLFVVKMHGETFTKRPIVANIFLGRLFCYLGNIREQDESTVQNN